MLSIFQRRKPPSLPLFALGTLKLSEKVHWLASKSLIDPLPYVQRHVRGDWGEINEAERQANNLALEQGAPMTSRFQITPQLFLIIATSDDQLTTVAQLPEERALICPPDARIRDVLFLPPTGPSRPDGVPWPLHPQGACHGSPSTSLQPGLAPALLARPGGHDHRCR